jgi:hypothetical protein
MDWHTPADDTPGSRALLDGGVGAKQSAITCSAWHPPAEAPRLHAPHLDRVTRARAAAGAGSVCQLKGEVPDQSCGGVAIGSGQDVADGRGPEGEA